MYLKENICKPNSPPGNCERTTNRLDTKSDRPKSSSYRISHMWLKIDRPEDRPDLMDYLDGQKEFK